MKKEEEKSCNSSKEKVVTETMREEYKLHMKCKLCSEPDEYDSSSSFSHVPYTLFSVLSMCLPLLHFPSYTKFSPSVVNTILYNIAKL